MSTETWTVIVNYYARSWTLQFATLPAQRIDQVVANLLGMCGEVRDPASLRISVAGLAPIDAGMLMQSLAALVPGRTIILDVTAGSEPQVPPSASSPVPAPAPVVLPSTGPERAGNWWLGEARKSDSDLRLAPPREQADFGDSDSGFELSLDEELSDSDEVKKESSDMVVALDDSEFDSEDSASAVMPRMSDAFADDDLDMEADEEAEAPMPMRSKAKPASARRPAAPSSRAVLVRYFSQMNPERVYDFEVTLSKKEIEMAAQAGVRQAKGTVPVRTSSDVEIEPILPGCTSYPPKDSVEITGDVVRCLFRVVPHVRGPVTGARVVLRQDGKPIGEIPLQVYVADTIMVRASGTCALFLPFVSALLKHNELDLESQLAQDFAPFRTALNWGVNNLRPEGLALALIALTVVAYFVTRPTRADITWDLASKRGSRPTFGARLARSSSRGWRAGLWMGFLWAIIGLLAGAAMSAVVGALTSWDKAASLARFVVPGLGGAALILGLLYGTVTGFIEGWSSEE